MNFLSRPLTAAGSKGFLRAEQRRALTETQGSRRRGVGARKTESALAVVCKSQGSGGENEQGVGRRLGNDAHNLRRVVGEVGRECCFADDRIRCGRGLRIVSGDGKHRAAQLPYALFLREDATPGITENRLRLVVGATVVESRDEGFMSGTPLVAFARKPVVPTVFLPKCIALAADF